MQSKSLSQYFVSTAGFVPCVAEKVLYHLWSISLAHPWNNDIFEDFCDESYARLAEGQITKKLVYVDEKSVNL